jgi:hypothetical protein
MRVHSWWRSDKHGGGLGAMICMDSIPLGGTYVGEELPSLLHRRRGVLLGLPLSMASLAKVVSAMLESSSEGKGDLVELLRVAFQCRATA